MSFGDFFNSSPMGMLFGGGADNPSDSANSYLSQIPDILKKYLQPYSDAGMGFLPDLQKQYGNLTNDPGGMINNIGQGYKQSPGFQFALQQALQGSNRSAAAGGMAGSPTAMQQNTDIATNMAGRDYNQWMQNALGAYGQGLSGEAGMYNSGQQAGMGLGQDIASALGQQGQYAYAGQAGKNSAYGNMWGNLMGLAGMGFMG